jgi:hypothetical protein
MPTKRIPVGRSAAPQITVAVIRMFEQLKRCRCTCDPDDRYTDCAGCKKRLALDEQIGRELKTPVWQYPCVERPGATNPYPRAHGNYEWWETRDPAPRELWLALERAARELRRQEREAQRANAARKAAAAPPPSSPPSSSPVDRP